ncbi:MAG: ATP-dependent DNA helicase RecG [Clostridium sp.]|nr:ATP-dependent DNA helicase RecG [Clostridium sp.]
MNLQDLKLEKEITTAKLNQFNKKGINNVEDLLRFAPIHYYDYSKLSSVADAVSGERAAFKVCIDSISKRMGNATPYILARCHEGSEKLSILWFDIYLFSSLADLKGQEVMVGGLYQDTEWGKQIMNPEVITPYRKESLRIYAAYKKIPGMSIQYFNNILSHALTEYNGDDYLDSGMLHDFGIISEKEMIKKLHMPDSKKDIIEARRRLILEKLYPLAKQMVEDALDTNKTSDYRVIKQDKYKQLLKHLPFSLTPDQKKIIHDFMDETKHGKRVRSLIQGDVGSGKTIVAFLMMILMADNGYQSVLMAPTGILARQHFSSFKEYADLLGLSVEYLGGDTKASDKKKICKRLADGDIQILVGTHAVISDNITFHNLGLTIVDEEHKFGVLQREALKEKAKAGIHHISMSATPIPRSLAQTVYGDSIDVKTIESMPEGRLPVKTEQVTRYKPMFAFMQKEILAGHQCYMVCPLIEDRAKEGIDFEKKERPLSVEEVQKMAEKYFENTNIKVAAINGKMKDTEKDEIIHSFEKNESQILIATTIIEVGVNVPNATVISILNAERFGLAGLHQLRGRVGRSNLQSYCMLVSNDTDNPRLKVMCKTTNGFEIAEEDMNLRGSGDIIGIKQSGEDERIALMLKYPIFFNKLKDYIRESC